MRLRLLQGRSALRRAWRWYLVGLSGAAEGNQGTAVGFGLLAAMAVGVLLTALGVHGFLVALVAILAAHGVFFWIRGYVLPF